LALVASRTPSAPDPRHRLGDLRRLRRAGEEHEERGHPVEGRYHTRRPRAAARRLLTRRGWSAEATAFAPLKPPATRSTLPSMARRPTCGGGVAGAAPASPFCSRRCRLLALGNWLAERYVVPGADDTSASDPAERDDRAPALPRDRPDGPNRRRLDD